MEGTPEGVYRSNPGYSAVLLDRLPDGQQEFLRASFAGDDLYGALVPRPESGLEFRSLSHETALLFFSLASPGPLPRFAESRVGEGRTAVKRLIVDGVLEVLSGDEFVSGPRYVAALAESEHHAGSATADGGAGQGSASVAALQYGQRLVGLSEEELALRLYCYGRQPISPQLRRWLPDREAVAEYLGLVPGGLAGRLAEEGWTPAPGRYWHQWLAPPDWRGGAGQAPDGRPGGRAPRYKLYVSPVVRQAGAALRHVVRAISATPGPTGFKVGADLGGICRPDMIIVYFDRLEDLHRLAGVLGGQLADLDGCGVPFTATITSDGLLSWGADPPGPAAAGELRGRSWRMWLARRLAHYLLTGRSAGLTSLEPWEFALSRLSLSGISTTSWTPSVGAWDEILETG